MQTLASCRHVHVTTTDDVVCSMLQCKLRNLVFGVWISWPRGKYLLASIYIHICKMEPLGKTKSHKQVVSVIRYNNYNTILHFLDGG